MKQKILIIKYIYLIGIKITNLKIINMWRYKPIQMGFRNNNKAKLGKLS